MSYDVTYNEYKKRLELKKEIIETLKEAKTKLLFSQAKGRSGSDLDRSSLPLIGSPADILETITKIEKLLNKINLDNQDDSIA
jgi:hypothetical protein